MNHKLANVQVSGIEAASRERRGNEISGPLNHFRAKQSIKTGNLFPISRAPSPHRAKSG